MRQHKKRPIHTQHTKHRSAPKRTPESMLLSPQQVPAATPNAQAQPSRPHQAEMPADVSKPAATKPNAPSTIDTAPSANANTSSSTTTTTKPTTTAAASSNAINHTPRKRIWLAVTLVGLLLFVAISGVAGFSYRQWQSWTHAQAQAAAEAEQTRAQLTSQLATLEQRLTEQQNALALLTSSNQTHYQELTRLADQLALTQPERIALLQVIQPVEAAHHLWQSGYNIKQTLALLQEAENAMREHQLTRRYGQFHLALLGDIQALSGLSPVNKDTLIRQLDAFTLRVQTILQSDAFLPSDAQSNDAENNASTSATETLTFGARLLSILSDAVVVRDKGITENLWHLPQALFIVHITANALLIQTRFALMHNDFYHAQQLLSELQTQFGRYPSLATLNQTIITLNNLVAELDAHSRIRLHSYRRLQLLSADRDSFLPSAAATTQNPETSEQSAAQEASAESADNTTSADTPTAPAADQ